MIWAGKKTPTTTVAEPRGVVFLGVAGWIWMKCDEIIEWGSMKSVCEHQYQCNPVNGDLIIGPTIHHHKQVPYFTGTPLGKAIYSSAFPCLNVRWQAAKKIIKPVHLGFQSKIAGDHPGWEHSTDINKPDVFRKGYGMLQASSSVQHIYIYIHNTHIYIIIIFYSIPPKYPKIINTQHLCHKSLDHVSPSEERKPALRSPTDPNRISGARYQTVTTSVTPVTCCFNMFELCKNMDPPVDLDWSCIYICYIYLQHEISIPDLSVSKPSSSTSSAASWVYFGIGTWVAWRSCGTAAKIRQARLLGAPPRRL